MTIHRVGMFHANYCGISSRTCGAGTYSINQLNALDTLNTNNNQQVVVPFWVGLDYAHNITEGDGTLIVNSNILDHTRAICQKWGGDVILTPNHDGVPFNVFWNEDQWLERSRLTAVQIVKKILKTHTSFDAIRIIANDIMYATLPKFILEELERVVDLAQNEVLAIKNKLLMMWIPHSTSKNYSAAGVSNNASLLREKIEQESINNAEHYGYTIGAIGQHFAQHLLNDYGLKKKYLKILNSGIFREPYLHVFDDTTIDYELNKLSIPTNCNYIFDLGQGVSHKGHDITIKVFAELINKNQIKYNNLHLVLLAPERIAQDRLHTQRIKMLINKFGIMDKITYISQWNADLAKYMYGCSRTLITLLPVRESPEDLVPMECRTNPSNSILITSDVGSNSYQVSNGEDGFLVSMKNTELDTIEQIHAQPNLYLQNKDWIAAIQQVLGLSKMERLKIVEAGKAKIAHSYDVIKNFKYNFIDINNELS